jgi:hypothetical protein
MTKTVQASDVAAVMVRIAAWTSATTLRQVHWFIIDAPGVRGLSANRCSLIHAAKLNRRSLDR